MRHLMIAASLALTVGSADAADGRFVYDKPILSLLGKIEGPGGYDEITNFARIKPPKPISQMRISEVLRYQERLRAAGTQSSAVGKYQFIYKTLNMLVDRHRIDPNQKMDARTQDFLARMLLNDCEYYNPSAEYLVVGDCLAKVWAAFPVMTGKNSGKSYHEGVAGNRALTSTRVMTAIIKNRTTRPVELRRSERVVQMANFPDDGRFADRIPLR